MKIIVLSLKNEIGEARREKLNYVYEIFWGIYNLNDVPEWVKCHMRRNNCSDSLFRGKCCHFFSYYSILKKIVEEKINDVIICEDDAILKEIKDINSDEPVLLNAELIHPTDFKKQKFFKFEDIDFKEGINEIDYSKYRWRCSATIYYPTYKSAEKIINFIDNCKTQFTHTDLFMAKHKLIKYLYYPSLFIIKDDKVSQINKPSGTIDNYAVKY